MNVESPVAGSEERFDAHFEAVVRKQLAAVNAYRKRTLLRILGWYAVLVPSVIAAFYGIGYLPVSHRVAEALLFVLLAATLVGCAIPYFTHYNPYRRAFKDQLVVPLVRGYRKGLTFAASAAIERSEFVHSGLFRERSVTHYGGEDCVTGRVGDTVFRFSEVDAEHLAKEANWNGRSRYGIFRGLFYVADFNKHFNGATYLLPDRAQKLLGGIGESMQSGRTPYGELVKLEDPEFEHEFVVYSNSQVEARYILSTALMRRIHALKVRTGKPLRIGFSGSKLYIAIASRRNHFEPRLFRSVHRGLFREFWDVLDIFAGIVDELNLNTRIWTKT